MIEFKRKSFEKGKKGAKPLLWLFNRMAKRTFIAILFGIFFWSSAFAEGSIQLLAYPVEGVKEGESFEIVCEIRNQTDKDLIIDYPKVPFRPTTRRVVREVWRSDNIHVSIMGPNSPEHVIKKGDSQTIRFRAKLNLSENKKYKDRVASQIPFKILFWPNDQQFFESNVASVTIERGVKAAI